MVKATLALLLAVTAAGLGNLSLAKGMQAIGPLESWTLAYLFDYFIQAFSNPWVIAGIFLEVAYFLLWLVVLAVSDVSWAVPMNAVEYIFVALLAVFWLGERVSSARWIGIVLISLGVFLMMQSWSERKTDELDSPR
ncbi:MAG: DMT family transporter [Deltaproteobacteria bacterium]|nr:DMT family transporter [Deltaproteobacteria bacterium]